MTELPGSDPILDDETLYRRIPASTHWYDPNRTPSLEPEAFRPNRNDESGISVARAKYTTMHQAALGRVGKQYYVAVLRAGDIRAAGMELAARPLSKLPRTISHQRLWRLCLMVMPPEDGGRLGPLAAKQRHAPAWDASPRK